MNISHRHMHRTLEKKKSIHGFRPWEYKAYPLPPIHRHAFHKSTSITHREIKPISHPPHFMLYPVSFPELSGLPAYHVIPFYTLIDWCVISRAALQCQQLSNQGSLGTGSSPARSGGIEALLLPGDGRGRFYFPGGRGLNIGWKKGDGGGRGGKGDSGIGTWVVWS